MQVGAKKLSFEMIRVQIASKQKDMSKYTKDIKSFEADLERSRLACEEAGKDQRRIANELKEFERRASDHNARVAEALKLNPWIESEKAYFGQKGSEYDFGTRDMDAIQQQKTSLQGSLVRYFAKALINTVHPLIFFVGEIREVSQQEGYGPYREGRIRKCGTNAQETGRFLIEVQ